jgi:hypothetical protein
MSTAIDLPRALLRYMIAVARMERNGVRIHSASLALLNQHWGGLQDQLIADIDQAYGVFAGRTFKADVSPHGFSGLAFHGHVWRPASWI